MQWDASKTKLWGRELVPHTDRPARWGRPGGGCRPARQAARQAARLLLLATLVPRLPACRQRSTERRFFRRSGRSAILIVVYHKEQPDSTPPLCGFPTYLCGLPQSSASVGVFPLSSWPWPLASVLLALAYPPLSSLFPLPLPPLFLGSLCVCVMALWVVLMEGADAGAGASWGEGRSLQGGPSGIFVSSTWQIWRVFRTLTTIFPALSPFVPTTCDTC